MQIITNEIGLGSIHTSLHIEAVIDGSVVWSEPGHSLVGNLMRRLYSRASGEDMPILAVRTARLSTSGGLADSDIFTGTLDEISFCTGITNVDGDPLVLLGCGFLNGRFDTAPNRAANSIMIGGIGGAHPARGIHKVTAEADAGGGLYNYTLDTIGDGVALPASENVWAGAMVPTLPGDGFESFIAGDPTLFIGLGNTAVAPDDQWLYDQIYETTGGSLTAEGSGTNVSSIGMSGNEAEIVYSRDFTNNSTALLAIREMGLFGQVGFETGGFGLAYFSTAMLSRDLVTIDLDVGKTVTINYRIKIDGSSDGSGGLLSNFAKQLHNGLGGSATPNMKSLIDTNVATSNETAVFRMAGPSGFNKHGGAEGQLYGIQVGTGTTGVVTDDYALETRVPHGTANGELFYYGTLVDNYRVVGNQVLFDVVRMIENKGATSVVITETGLYGVRAILTELTCYARNKLAVTHTIASGEIAKLVYTFSLTTGV